jgi:hypothetical protein
MPQKYSRFLSSPSTSIQLMGRPFALRGGVVNPFPADDYLQQLVDWRDNAMQTVAPGPYTVEEPDYYKDEKAWGTWDWDRQMHIRGLSEEWNYKYVKRGIENYGLDVILHIAPLPFEDPGNFLWNLRWAEHPLWAKKAKLISVDIEYGPAWVEFIASDFRTPAGYHHHVSVCYTHELKEWFDHLWSDRGREFALEQAYQWYMKYQVIRERYDRKRARLKGRFTSGMTYQLNQDSNIEGLDVPYVLWDGFSGADYTVEPNCDPEMFFVHTLPGNNFNELAKQNKLNTGSYKSLQHMHVSLLLE